MMIKKKYVKSRNVYKVTFEIPKSELPDNIDVESVSVVGDFNGWDETADEMKANKKGTYKAQMDLEPGNQYQFRYLANGEHWFNAWEADGYGSNEYGVDNCLIITPPPLDN